MLDHLSHGRARDRRRPRRVAVRAEIPQGRARAVARHFHRRLQVHQRRAAHRPADLQGPALPVRERADRAASAAKAASARSGTAHRAPKARPGPASRGCISSRSARTSFAKDNIDTFKAAFAKRGGKAAQPKAEFPGGVAIGVQRHIFVDDTDEKAKRLGQARDGEPPQATSTGCAPSTASPRPPRGMKNVRGATFEECVEEGSVIAGSPATVLAEIERHAQGDRLQLPADLHVPRHHVADRRHALAASCSPPR